MLLFTYLEAEVVSMYEEGDFVYTFFREKAIEVTTRISQVNAKIGHIVSSHTRGPYTISSR